MKITIIIPTYNEGQAISSLIKAVLNETRVMTQHDFSILVVDGKSPDNTAEVVRNIMKENRNIHLLVEKEKRGLGNAYRVGMNYAIDTLESDAFMEFDGDFQHNPSDIQKLIEKLDQGYDYIIGSRYVPGGTIPREWPWYRKFLSAFGNQIIRFGLRINIHDGTSGFKLSRVNGFRDKMPLKEGELISLRHAYKIHFLYSMIRGGAKTIEVPINFLNRNKGISKSTFEDIIESLKVVGILAIYGDKRILKNK